MSDNNDIIKLLNKSLREETGQNTKQIYKKTKSYTDEERLEKINQVKETTKNIRNIGNRVVMLSEYAKESDPFKVQENKKNIFDINKIKYTMSKRNKDKQNKDFSMGEFLDNLEKTYTGSLLKSTTKNMLKIICIIIALALSLAFLANNPFGLFSYIVLVLVIPIILGLIIGVIGML